MEIGRNLISSLYQAISKINILLRLTLKTLMLIEIQIDSCKESASSSSLTPKEAICCLESDIIFSRWELSPSEDSSKIEKIKDKLCALDMKILLEPLSQHLLQTHFRSRSRDGDKTRINKDNSIEKKLNECQYFGCKLKGIYCIFH